MSHEGWWSRFYEKFGLQSLQDTGKDAYCIILARASRMFAYGANSLILALFFSELNFSDFRIGLFMSLTLLGDVVLTILLTSTADRIGRRRTILLGSVLMICSGLTFVVAENFWILLFAAVVGVISSSGGDFGPFRAIEESMLSQLAQARARNDVLSWYVTASSFGSALGTGVSGRLVDGLQAVSEWPTLKAYHAIFTLYIVMGGLNIVLVGMMSPRTEIGPPTVEENADEVELLNGAEPVQDLDADLTDVPQRSLDSFGAVETQTPTKPAKSSILSESTRSVMYKLWPLLAVDSMADGMTNLSLTTYYLEQKFQTATSTLGDINSIAYFLAAASTIFAGPLSNALGLVNTMVFTHVPSSAAVMLFPLPRSLWLTVVLFYIRQGLNNMDQAPRAAFIAAAVKPGERTAVLGWTSTLRTLAATAGPSITGLLAGNDRFWLAFVVAGAFRLAYDFGLWALFVNLKLEGMP